MRASSAISVLFPAPVGPTSATIWPGSACEGHVVQHHPLGARIGERDVPELDAAGGPVEGGRIVGDDHGRLGLQDAVEPRHRGRATLVEVDDPTHRDHGPDQQHEVEAERDEVAHRDAPGDHLLAAEPQHQHHRQAGDEPEHRMERPRRDRQPHVPLAVLVVERVELAGLLRLLRVRPHDAHAGEVLLHHGRQRGELLLDLLEALVDHPAEADHDGRQDHHGDHRVRASAAG